MLTLDRGREWHQAERTGREDMERGRGLSSCVQQLFPGAKGAFTKYWLRLTDWGGEHLLRRLFYITYCQFIDITLEMSLWHQNICFVINPCKRKRQIMLIMIQLIKAIKGETSSGVNTLQALYIIFTTTLWTFNQLPVLRELAWHPSPSNPWSLTELLENPPWQSPFESTCLSSYIPGLGAWVVWQSRASDTRSYTLQEQCLPQIPEHQLHCPLEPEPPGWSEHQLQWSQVPQPPSILVTLIDREPVDEVFCHSRWPHSLWKTKSTGTGAQRVSEEDWRVTIHGSLDWNTLPAVYLSPCLLVDRCCHHDSISSLQSLAFTGV